ncbi:hypothetical protein BD414DRAFT_491937 [Trametes punicea]|nr:hypothetical protein BD414DRAFT_491937 [Trametes punicea]
MLPRREVERVQSVLGRTCKRRVIHHLESVDSCTYRRGGCQAPRTSNALRRRRSKACWPAGRPEYYGTLMVRL